MAEPILQRGLELLLYKSDGATPAVFSFFCGILSKTATWTRAVSEAAVLDCDDPTATPWMRRTAGSRSLQISGSGQMAMENLDELEASFNADGSEIWRLGIKGRGYWEGAFQLTSRELAGAEDGGFISLTIELQSDGPVVWTDDPTFAV